MPRLKVGDFVEPRTLQSVQGSTVTIPPPDGFLHLQFRRFAGCPICNLHLQSFLRRHAELVGRAIHEVAIFHSSKDAMLEHQLNAPFPYIADPEERLYKLFGVEKSVMSVLNPSSWPSAVRGLISQGPGLPSRGESALGLPADFLINTAGRVVAVKYGTHASDQWEMEELFSLVASAQKSAPADVPQTRPAV